MQFTIRNVFNINKKKCKQKYKYESFSNQQCLCLKNFKIQFFSRNFNDQKIMLSISCEKCYFLIFHNYLLPNVMFIINMKIFFKQRVKIKKPNLKISCPQKYIHKAMCNRKKIKPLLCNISYNVPNTFINQSGIA